MTPGVISVAGSFSKDCCAGGVAALAGLLTLRKFRSTLILPDQHFYFPSERNALSSSNTSSS